jgi:GTP cyclohydrolase I/GTP cyclohydrolase-4
MERSPDVQASKPAVPVSLSLVGVNGVEKVIRIGTPDAASPRLYSARLDCFVDLGPEQKGAHMSRFEEAVNEVIGEVILGEVALRAEKLARHIADRVRQRQNALRAEVTIAARCSKHNGVAAQEMYTLHASAVAFEHGTRQIVGVSTDGRDQRGLGTLHLGCPARCETDVDAADLLTVIESSWSRGADGECVREMLRAVLERYGELPDDAFVLARQEKLGTVQRRNVVAERYGLLGELRTEWRGGAGTPHHTSRREWLDAVGGLGASARSLA